MPAELSYTDPDLLTLPTGHGSGVPAWVSARAPELTVRGSTTGAISLAHYIPAYKVLISIHHHPHDLEELILPLASSYPQTGAPVSLLLCLFAAAAA